MPSVKKHSKKSKDKHLCHNMYFVQLRMFVLYLVKIPNKDILCNGATLDS
jgi:hypothetical protein